MSFGFIVRPEGQIWAKDNDGRVLRSLTAVRLFDISPVVFAAYPETAVAVRALNAWTSDRRRPATALLRRWLDVVLID